MDRSNGKWNFKKKSLRDRVFQKDYDNLAGLFFIFPWLIGFILFMIIPIVMSIFYSFTRFDIISPPVWIGVDNFIAIVRDARFLNSVKVTMVFAFIAVPARLVFALILALLFYKARRLVGFYRAAFYLPSILGGSVAVAITWQQLFGTRGALNSMLNAAFGLELTMSWIGSPDTALASLVLLHLWQFGSPMLIFLAGLKQIPRSLYESASIDGATSVQNFFKITLPMLTPIIFFNLILQTISGLMMFTQAFLITDGGPIDRTMVIMLYVYGHAFEFFNMGYASAMTWVVIISMFVITMVIFKTSKYWVFYESKGDL